MKVIVKKTNETVEVERVPVYVDEMTSYFVYENTQTKETYKYNDIKFIS